MITYTMNEFNQKVGDIVSNWQTAQRPTTASIRGAYCNLTPLSSSNHAKSLFQAFSASNESSWTYLPYGPFTSFAEFLGWLTKMSSGTDPFFYTIMDTVSRLPIGLASYSRISPEHGVIEIGHLHFSASLRQSTAATEAMFLMLREVFDNLGYRRCEWKCNSLNEPSKMAALRLGFQHEGTFRQDRIVKNRSRDTDWYSIMDTEWPFLRRRFENWLNPQNFHADGKQKVRLSEMNDVPANRIGFGTTSLPQQKILQECISPVFR